MTSLVGRVDQFDPNLEHWQLYVDRLGHFLDANGITDEGKKRSVFLAVIGPAAYRLLISLIAPAKPGEKGYDDLVKTLTEHYDPAPSEIVQRYKFHTRIRQSGETIATFVAELRRIAQYCNFGDSLNDSLRDRLVCGVNEDNIQRRLLSEKVLTFDKAMEIAVSMETAKKNGDELQAMPPTVHKVCSLSCYRCGKNHLPDECNLKGAKCFSCGKIGHIQKACRSVLPKKRNFPHRSRSDHRSVVRKPRKTLPNHKPQPIRRLTEEGGTTDFLVKQLHSDNNNPIELTMDIANKPLKMELDTGASVSLISAKTFATLQSSRQLQKSNTVLRTYSGEQIRVVGNIDVSVKYNTQVVTLPLLVIEGEGPSLLGRNWLKHIKLDWKSIHIMKGDDLQLMLERHRGAFRDGLGKLQGYQAKIIIEPEATPKFCKARTVPYSMKVKIEEELDRLVSLGILQPVQFSDWAMPIVPVLKSHKSVRICGDFKVTVNPVSKLDRYPIPRIEDLFATLGGGTTFTKLDMSQAYQQIELEDSSRQCTVINTHKGLFQYNRLPFGISSAPAIFQRVMESLLVTGRTNEEHLESLELVLKRMEEAGLLLKKEKCSFMASSVTYLGHVIDADGLHPIVEKVDAIKEAPSPKNLTQLKSYLGLLTCYNRFLPNLSTVLFPLYRLLRKKNLWTWTTKEETAFKASKELLMSSNLLVHFDPSLELILACDASPYGIGAVITHRMPDGSEKPIGFVSRTLTPAEKNYSQLEQEGLACVFGIKKFHSYLFGRSFSIYTDNLPLKSLFSEKQAVPVQASGRILRWALTLASYEYKILFRPTHKHGNADALRSTTMSKYYSSRR